MAPDRIVVGLTAAFGGMSLVLTIIGVLTNPAVLLLAAVFGLVAGLFYYQASGRLARRVYRGVERRAAVDRGRGAGRRHRRADRGDTGAGPKGAWRRPRGGRADRGGQRATDTAEAQPTDAAAYRTLGLDPGADQAEIREAYRDRVKEVHPDADGGDRAAFRRVREAYEHLAE